jgi:hypothetical protein
MFDPQVRALPEQTPPDQEHPGVAEHELKLELDAQGSGAPVHPPLSSQVHPA